MHLARRVLMPVSVTLALALAGLGLSPARAAVQDLFLNVSFPADTTVNPDFEPYRITVDDSRTTGTLYAEFLGSRQEIPHSGTVDLTLGDREGSGEVVVVRCTTTLLGDTKCVDTGHHSPTITVRRHVALAYVTGSFDPVSPNGDGVHDTVQVSFTVPTTERVTTTWTYQDDALRPVDTPGGSVESTPGPDGRVEVAVEPVGLDSGSYRLALAVTVPDPDFGRLTGMAGWSFTVDLVAPPSPTVVVPRLDFFPYVAPLSNPDYPSRLSISIDWRDDAYATHVVQILDADGAVVRRLDLYAPSWNGKDADGSLVAPGTYAVRARATDRAGNSTVTDVGGIVVRPERLVDKVMTKTFGAAQAVVGKFVGRCSTLRRPSARGWPGSLGYYSNSRCHARDRASWVGTAFAFSVPRDAVALGTLTIGTYGGAARTAPRSRAVMAFLDHGDTWDSPQLVGSALRRHRTLVSHPSVYVTQGCFFYELYVDRGEKYDVKDFRVRLEYQVVE